MFLSLYFSRPILWPSSYCLEFCVTVIIPQIIQSTLPLWFLSFATFQLVCSLPILMSSQILKCVIVITGLVWLTFLFLSLFPDILFGLPHHDAKMSHCHLHCKATIIYQYHYISLALLSKILRWFIVIILQQYFIVFITIFQPVYSLALYSPKFWNDSMSLYWNTTILLLIVFITIFQPVYSLSLII